MRRKFMNAVATVVTVVAVLVVTALAKEASLHEQLAAQYKLAKVGSDTSGYSIVEEGTLLSVQKGGMIGVPYKDTSPLVTNRFEGGEVHPPNTLARKGWNTIRTHLGQEEQTTKLFHEGDKVYPTKLEVNIDRDTVTMGIVACDSCNKTDPPTANKAQVVFQFPKGSLTKASAGEVVETIGHLLVISGDEQKSESAPQDQNTTQNQESGQDSPTQDAPAQPAELQEIKAGMTVEEVEAALGEPVSKVDLRVKQIYLYKDLKVTFKDGKVSDVQ